MICFAVLSDLQPYVLGTRVKRDDERSPNHHLVVLKSLAGEKTVQACQTQTCCEGLLGKSSLALLQGGLQPMHPEELLRDPNGAWGH